VSEDSLVAQIALVAVPAILAITLHEAAHGYVALKMGDDTALKRGRITLNPLKHIDPVGTILLPLLLVAMHAGFVFGYAKPVPVNGRAFHNPKRDMIWVAAAGPAMNFLLAIASAALLWLVSSVGSGIAAWLAEMLSFSVEINIVLALFNLIPIPPLDGGRVLIGVLPGKAAVILSRAARYGLLLLLLVLIVVPLIGERFGVDIDPLKFLAVPVSFLTRHLLGPAYS
jgi:Zn-dependent protease